MQYSAARALIRSGDILAWCGTQSISQLIRHVEGGSWSHVGIAWVIGGRVLVLQAQEFSGINIMPLSQLLPVDWISTSIHWTEAVEAKALARVGEAYSYLDALRVGLGLRPHSDKICSLFANSIDGFDFSPEGLTPSRLVELLMDNGKFLRRLTAV